MSLVTIMCLAIFFLVTILILIFGPLKYSAKEFVEFDDLFTGKYRPQYFNGTWISDETFLYPHNTTLLIYNVTNQQATVVLKNLTLDGHYTYISLSSDVKFALFSANRTPIYRYSSEAQYKILDLESEYVFSLDNNNYLQLVEWSPRGHNLMFIKKNNLYYVSNTFSNVDCLTADGVPGIIFNGVADWVYEEEVLSDTKAFWFSQDGSHIVYIKFNDSRVHELNYVWYGSIGSKKSQYPEVKSVRYPKAGTQNPALQVFVIELSGFLNFELDGFDDFTFVGEALLTNVLWTPNNELSLTWTNRIQNHANVYRCRLDFRDSLAKCTMILNMFEEHGWLDPSPVVFSSIDESFLLITPLLQQDWRNYPQLVLINSTKDWIPLTQGLQTVKNIIGWDQKKNVVFYEAVQASHSSEAHVYMVQIDTGLVSCLSCHLDYPCGYASVSFSSNFTYHSLICKGPDVPFVNVYYTYVEKTHPPILIWQRNECLQETLKHIALPTIQEVVVPLENNIFTALARIYLPPQLDRMEPTKYPLILSVYGGPGLNKIDDRFKIDWDTYLVSKRNIIVVFIDGRGSAYRSKEQEYAVYRNLGKFEIEDQIAVVKFLMKKFDFIDQKRIGVWGWSYGGFATSMILATDSTNVFHCGISVAPVTNFLYYDSVYTERYMGLPSVEDNEAGYNWTDVSRKVTNFSNKTFFLIHGTADDNVHYQQSMMLSKALEAGDILFYEQSYPDQNHNIGTYRRHVYHSMNHFWTDCFNLNESLV